VTEHTHTVISTEIIAQLPGPEDFTVERITGPIMPRPYRPWFKVKLAVLIDDGSSDVAVHEYEAEIPHVQISRRQPTPEEFILARELAEVERRHQERLERRLRWPR
jgi:hypothetical protein